VIISIEVFDTRVDDIDIIHWTRLFTYIVLHIHLYLLHRGLLDGTPLSPAYSPWLTYPITRDPVLTCTCITVAQILWHVTPVVRIHVHHFTEHRYFIYCDHRYMDTLHITITHACMVSLFLPYGSLLLLHALLCHAIPVFLLYDWLIPVTDIVIPITGCMSFWYAMCAIPHLLFQIPVMLFYAINRAQVLLSCYIYHVLYLFLLHCVISDHKDNFSMGETWWLTRSYRVDVWIRCLSHCRGRGSAGYRLLLMSSRFPLLF